MTEPKDVTFEFNVFDDGRTHLKMIGPGTPSLTFLAAAKERLLDFVELWNRAQESPGTPADEPREASEPKQDKTPHCKAKGVWAAAKGRWPEGFKPDWKHKETRINKKGELYCPTPIGKDDGKLIWCGWRAVQREDGTWEEWDLNATDP